jgi:tetratricopeptide (TPR) repeat protein
LTNLRWGRNLSGLDGLMADQAFALYVFGVHKQDLGDLKNAELSFKKALVLIKKCKNKDSVMVYKYGMLGSLIELYRYYGYTEQATFIANEAQKIENDKYLSPIDRVFVNERIASLKYYLGMYDEAQNILERSLKIRYTILSQDHYKIGCTKTFLGLVLSANNDVTNAISTLEEAEKILEKNFERDHIYYIFLYLNMSYAYEMQKRYDMALKYIEKSQQAVRERFGDGPYEILLNYFSPIEKLPALVNSTSSHNYYVKSLDIIKMLFGENHIRTARYNYLLGQSFENIKNENKAIEHYINALSIARKQTFNSEILIKEHHKNIQIIQRSLQSLSVKASI